MTLAVLPSFPLGGVAFPWMCMEWMSSFAPLFSLKPKMVNAELWGAQPSLPQDRGRMRSLGRSRWWSWAATCLVQALALVFRVLGEQPLSQPLTLAFRIVSAGEVYIITWLKRRFLATSVLFVYLSKVCVYFGCAGPLLLCVGFSCGAGLLGCWALRPRILKAPAVMVPGL